MLRFAVVQMFNSVLLEFLPNFHFTRDNKLLSILEDEVQEEERREQKKDEVTRAIRLKFPTEKDKQQSKEEKEDDKEEKKEPQKSNRDKKEEMREKAESLRLQTLSLAQRIIRLKRLLFMETKEKLF